MTRSRNYHQLLTRARAPFFGRLMRCSIWIPIHPRSSRSTVIFFFCCIDTLHGKGSRERQMACRHLQAITYVLSFLSVAERASRIQLYRKWSYTEIWCHNKRFAPICQKQAPLSFLAERISFSWFCSAVACLINSCGGVWFSILSTVLWLSRKCGDTVDPMGTVGTMVPFEGYFCS